MQFSNVSKPGLLKMPFNQVLNDTKAHLGKSPPCDQQEQVHISPSCWLWLANSPLSANPYAVWVIWTTFLGLSLTRYRFSFNKPPNISWGFHLVHLYYCRLVQNPNVFKLDVFFWDRFFQCTPGWPRTSCVDRAGFKLVTILLPLPLECWNYRYAY